MMHSLTNLKIKLLCLFRNTTGQSNWLQCLYERNMVPRAKLAINPFTLWPFFYRY